jgi:transposase-like protein
VVKKLRDTDAMLAAGKSVGEVLQVLEISEATLSRWRSQYGGMKSEEAKRLKSLEDENNRLKKIVADQALDIQMLKEIAKGN